MKKDTKDRDLVNILLCMLLIVTLIANVVQFWNYKSYERFDWSGGVISSNGNIVQVANCQFKGNYYNIKKDMILDDGWQEINECDNYMRETFFPDTLSVKWFSYKEQKFYSGSFALPSEFIENKAIQMGIKNDYTWDRILQFVAEIQPQGKVTVWIRKPSIENEQRFKIGMFQAKEIMATWHIFDDHLEEPDSISNIDVAKKVALVMKQYNYKIKIKLPDGYLLKDSQVFFFNKKNLYLGLNDIQNAKIINFLPESFTLTWGKGKRKFTTEINFDENVVLDFFQKVNNNKDEIILEIYINNQNNVLKATLKNTVTNLEVILKNKYPAQFGGDIIELK